MQQNTKLLHETDITIITFWLQATDVLGIFTYTCLIYTVSGKRTYSFPRITLKQM